MRPSRGYTRAPLALAPPSRQEVLLDGLGAAAELIDELRGHLGTLARGLVLGVVLLEREHLGRRDLCRELGRRLGDAAADAMAWRRVAEKLADRAADAEVRLDLVRAALPALRATTTRRELAAIVDEIERATQP